MIKTDLMVKGTPHFPAKNLLEEIQCKFKFLVFITEILFLSFVICVLYQYTNKRLFKVLSSKNFLCQTATNQNVYVTQKCQTKLSIIIRKSIDVPVMREMKIYLWRKF